ncbi:MAG: hypothetical protein U1F43_27710 [Myxococcota bacterium]
MRHLFAALCLAAPIGGCLESIPAGTADGASSALSSHDATGASHDSHAADSASPTDSANAPGPDVTNSCTARAERCTDSAECCPGSYCTRDPMSYADEGICAEPQPDGAYCVADGWCLSGTCHDNVCGAATCTAAGVGCMYSGECCPGLFCSGGPYVYGECTAPAPRGSPCENDSWCSTGLCVDGICAVAGCGATGSECASADACCSGLCVMDSYGPMHCGARVGIDAFCQDDSWCTTGLCRDYTCAAECQARNEGCYYDSDCCADLYCQWSDAIGMNGCAPKLAVGTACSWDGVCQSSVCRDGVCQNEGCLATETECYSDGECCTGACSYDNMSYAPGRCFVPAATGQACMRDAWCSSQRCVDGACQ